MSGPSTHQDSPTTHELKCWPPYFEDILAGRKNFECRVADRDYKPGDLLRLKEYDPEKGYVGRELTRCVTYVLHGDQFGIRQGHVVLALVLPIQGGDPYVPVSALLSDEVVETHAGQLYARYCELPAKGGFEGENPGARERWLDRAREDLQAAIEQVGGGQGG